MKVSWDTINRNMDQIIEEFERLYVENKDFSECEKILKDIFNIFSAKRGITLDSNEDFDHVFHQLYTEIQNVMSTAQPIKSSQIRDYKSLKEFFATISEDVFKTAEIRGRLKEIDPSNIELRKAYEKGIEEAEARKLEIGKRLEFYHGIKDELYETGEPNLRGTVDREIISLGYLDEIKTKLDEIKPLQDVVDNPNGLSQEDIDANKEEIKKLYDEIQKSIDQLNIAKQVDQTRLNKLKTLGVDDALVELSSIINDLNVQTTNDFTKLQTNLQTVAPKHPNLYAFQNIDYSKMDPSTEEGRQAILDAFKPLDETIRGFEGDLRLYNAEIDAFNNQMRVLDEEDKILDAEAPTEAQIRAQIPDSIKAMKEADLSYYTDMVNAQMYGDEAYKEKYDRYLSLFKRHIKSGNSFVLRNEDGTEITETDSNGNIVPKIGTYTTVDYQSMQEELNRLLSDPELASGYDSKIEDIIKFLQLEEYQSKIERATKITAGDKLASTEYKAYEKFIKATNPEEKNLARLALKEEMEAEGTYIKTFHGATNDYMFHKEHHRTAGKYADTNLPMLKLRDQEGLPAKLKAAGHNVYAFSRWQNPLKVEGLGKKVLVMGSNIINVATIPVRLPLKGLGVVVSNIKYGEEDVDPNPYNGRADARRGARVDYYVENGNSKFIARAKGWIDEIPFIGKSRKTSTEQAIVDRQIEEIKKNLDFNYEDAAVIATQAEIERQKEVVRENRRLRTEDARIIASSRETQGDIFREPSEASDETLKQRTLARLALEYEGIKSEYVSNTGSRNPAKNPRRNTQFENPENLRTITGVQTVDPRDLEKVVYTRPKGKDSAVVAADPIGRAIRSKEIKNTLTRFYTIPYLLALKGEQELVKYGISKLKTTSEVTTPRYEQVGTEQVRVENGGHIEYVTRDEVSYVEGSTAESIKLGDLEYGNTAAFEHTGTVGRQVAWIEQPTSQNIQAMSLDFVVPNNLDANAYEALAKLGYKAGDRISYSVADEATRNLCQATGRSYASSYIDGLFSFDDGMVITDAIEQYFPEKVSSALDTILGSEAYAGKTGVDFLTDSFSTSHGVTSIMESMKGWGTGWATETVKAEAIETAQVLKEIHKEVTSSEWIVDYILKDKPIMEWVDHTETITDATKALAKAKLNRINNGLSGVLAVESAHELLRGAKLPKKETGRETFSGDDERI